MKRKKILVIFLFFSFLLEAKHSGDYLNVVTTRYLTEHLDWARPLPGKKVKCLFIVGRQGAREVVELWQRMDIEFDAFTVFHAGLLAMEDMYEGQVEGTTLWEKKNEILAKLEKDYDVFILGNVRFDILPAEAKYKILERVKKGAGLVFFYDHGTIYKKIFATPENTDWITQGLSLKSLPLSPSLAKPSQQLAPEKRFKTEELLKGYQFGKGRILIVNYPGKHSTYYSGLALTNPERYSRFWKADYENYMVLVARAILWAARKQKDFLLTPLNFQNEESIKQENLPFPLVFKAETAEKLKIFVRIRDMWNQVHKEQEMNIQNGKLQLNLPVLPAGRYFLDYLVKKGKEVEDFGFFTFQVESRWEKVALDTDKISCRKGEKIKGKLTFEQVLPEETNLLVEISDSISKKTYLRKEYVLPRGAGSLEFEIAVSDFPSLCGYLQCSIRKNNLILAKVEKEVFFPEKEEEIFPNILWGGINDYLSELYQPQVRKAGFTCSLNHPTEEGGNARIASIFNLKMVPYLYRIMLGRDDQGWTQELWLKTNDPKNKEKYGGDGSFYNPVVQKEVREVISKRMTNLPLYGMLVYSLGDENFFHYESGFSPSEERAFREYLRKKYGKIEILNQEWGENFSSFEQVKHYRLREAAHSKKYAAWYDHRCFLEKQYADYHHYLARLIKEIDPGARVGAEGSVPGNLEETISQLEFWGPYADKIGNELLRSIGWDKLRTNWWGGYVGSHGGRDAYPYPLWKPLLCGIINGNSWFASGPWVEGFISVDFSYADYFEKMLPRIQKLNNGLAQLLVMNRLKNEGIAVHWSHASSSIALLGEPFVSPENSTGQLIDFCYRQGCQFEFLTTREMEKGRLRDYKILFLFGSSSISDGEKKEIENFVKNGGILVADMNPGILNGYCRPVEKGQLVDILGVELSGKQKFVFRPVKIDTEISGRRIVFQAEKVQVSPESDIFHVKQTGKGLALLLNFDLSSAFNTSSQVAFDRFLSDLLEIAGVKRQIEVQGVNEEKTIVRLRENPEYQILGILCPKEDVGRKISVRMAKTYHIYKADEGFIKQAECFEDKVKEPFLIYTLFAEKQGKPEVKLAKTKVQRGETIRLLLPAAGAGRIYRVRVYQPGEEIFRNVFPCQQEFLEIPVAFNEKPGRYTVEVTDVATGLRESVSLEFI